MLYTGSCHCGAVHFEIDAPSTVKALSCNCSICKMTGYQHWIVPKRALINLTGEENLACYQFNKKIAQHFFCSTCGIKPFYVPRSHPDQYSVNVRCLDPQPEQLELKRFDGRNWESSVDEIND